MCGAHGAQSRVVCMRRGWQGGGADRCMACERAALARGPSPEHPPTHEAPKHQQLACARDLSPLLTHQLTAE